MGYTTDFSGELDLTPAASPELTEYINRFASTRRIKRDVQELMRVYAGEHGLNESYGIEGEFFAYDDGDFGQNEYTGVIDQNTTPSTQPGLWSQWVLSDDGTRLEWDGGEKFYNYVEWLNYYIKNFLAPNGILLNGEIRWTGEDSDDMGKIVVKDNKVTLKLAVISWE